jgi:16S rRNA (guanine(966)-N(2))-methyltransferase RsmD
MAINGKPLRRRPKAGPAGRFRIIGGSWRGRRLPVPPDADVRPTPDRVRETVFNWLAPTIAGARCLDLYAGSGALGLEALSRGASRVVFVDRSPAVLRQLAASLAVLGATSGETVGMDAMSYLEGPARAIRRGVYRSSLSPGPGGAGDGPAGRARLAGARGERLPGARG